ALFAIDATTGALSFKSAPNFESPADAGGDNVYDVTVQAKDKGGLVDTQAIAVTVTDVNDVAPTITSAATASEAENTAAGNVVYTVAATDPDTVGSITYSIDGTDAALFNIDGKTGAVTFKASPDFEAPADAGKNNVYDITVHANDGVHDAAKAVAITVTDVNDVASTFTSGATGTEAENSATTNVVYDADVTDPDGGANTFS